MKTQSIKTAIFRENEDLVAFIRKHIKKIPEKSVLVITSKIVALSEGRVENDVSEKSKERLVRKESQRALKTKWAWLTIKDGQMMASAGIDESNANGKFILLPKDSFAAAIKIRKEIRKIYKLKNVGVLITDSRTTPLRSGVTGTALGYAGFRGLRDYVGGKDIFGRKFKFSKTNVADSLSTSAVLCMGEGNEQMPLALITDAPIKFSEKVNKNELKISLRDDMYRPLFQSLK